MVTDQRYIELEKEKIAEQTNINNTYTGLQDERATLDNQGKDLINNWTNTQQNAQEQQTQFLTDTINQQKGLAEKDYLKEAKASNTDYMRQINAYGVDAETRAAQGLIGSGYEETTKGRMYNSYQNRVATARDGYNRAVMNYDNNIKEALMTKNIKMAEIAYMQLEKQLNLAIDSFGYRDQITREKLNMSMQVGDKYYSRTNDVYNKIMQEQQIAEDARRYNEQVAYQKQQDALAQSNWLKEYNLALKKASASGGSSRSSSGGGLDPAKYNLTDANMKDNGAGDGTYSHKTLGGVWRVRTNKNGVAYYEPADEKTQKIYNQYF